MTPPQDIITQLFGLVDDVKQEPGMPWIIEVQGIQQPKGYDAATVLFDNGLVILKRYENGALEEAAIMGISASLVRVAVKGMLPNQ